MTAADLIRAGDFAPKTLRSIEKGRGPRPRADTLLRLDKQLGWVPGSAERLLVSGLAPRVAGKEADDEAEGDPMFLDLPQHVTDSLTEVELAEARAAASAAFLSRVREIRAGHEGRGAPA